ncbi:MAG: hypothetical protein HY908_10160 [Myxococcales bacterium]|nr:hypothetical protein [Myxococcales bacterium]
MAERRGLAGLLLALLGLAAAGCRPDTCASPCPPSVNVAQLCAASGVCSIDGAIVWDLRLDGTLDPGQALVVALGFLDITGTPQLSLRFVGVAPPPAGVQCPTPSTTAVSINGVAGAYFEPSIRRGMFDGIDVYWSNLPAPPRTLVIARGDSSSCTDIALAAEFVDADCENAHPRSCE